MIKQILCLLLLVPAICFAGTEGVTTPTVEGVVAATVEGVTHGAVCDLSSGASVMGLTAISETTSSKTANDVLVGQYPLNSTLCTVDEIRQYFYTQFGTGEYVVAGIYWDHDNNGTADLQAQSSALQGNGTAEEKIFTLGSAVSITGTGTYFIVYHLSAGMNLSSSSSLASTYATKTISGTHTYSGTMPSSIDVSSMATTYGWRGYAAAP